MGSKGAVEILYRSELGDKDKIAAASRSIRTGRKPVHRSGARVYRRGDHAVEHALPCGSRAEYAAKQAAGYAVEEAQQYPAIRMVQSGPQAARKSAAQRLDFDAGKISPGVGKMYDCQGGRRPASALGQLARARACRNYSESPNCHGRPPKRPSRTTNSIFLDLETGWPGQARPRQRFQLIATRIKATASP